MKNLKTSSHNLIEEGVGSDEDDAPKRRGFRDEVDLRLGARNTTNVNRKQKKRERQTEKSHHIQI